MKRVGERGEGKWQRIEWPDALDEIADKLDKLRNATAVRRWGLRWNSPHP